jgi:protein-disulfide isomerase
MLVNQGQQGQQSQAFFISNDDTAFYFLGDGPFDLSRSSEELQAELAKRKEAEAVEKAERIGQLDALAADQPFRGDADGKVTIVEFSDFQCPYCSRAAATVEEILEKYNENVKVVYMNLPLVSIHPWAMGASIAAVCAADQDPAAFWKLHDGFFANQGSINSGNLVDKATEWIADSGLDMAAWKTCSSDNTSDSYKAAQEVVNAQMKLGQQLGVTGTPAFFVNGAFLNGAQPLASFVPLIDEILAN